ncbi:hypothetical protein [Arsenophonus sp. PmNCSU2021_1]|uniref:hypothetical protein n=1 Tax=Arsenophonus sp. PmNCSU2021_1 TaxID=3118989 RepID=UPI002FEF9079
MKYGQADIKTFLFMNKYYQSEDSVFELKMHYSASDLARMKLPGLPATSRNINERAKKMVGNRAKEKGKVEG